MAPKCINHKCNNFKSGSNELAMVVYTIQFMRIGSIVWLRMKYKN